ncbi:hypothetical protein [Streptomyces geranii]|uniref:hypothetical protein n=1 Tax=Streptomyces geranii TaxID=2058923 RepID=UPI002FCD758F
MPDTQTATTELTSHYTAQVAGDLDRNAKEQDRIGAEIDALQEQLRALQYDHTLLTNMQKSLGGPGHHLPARSRSGRSALGTATEDHYAARYKQARTGEEDRHRAKQ